MEKYAVSSSEVRGAGDLVTDVVDSGCFSEHCHIYNYLSILFKHFLNPVRFMYIRKMLIYQILSISGLILSILIIIPINTKNKNPRGASHEINDRTAHLLTVKQI